MDDFLTKPFDQAGLAAMLRRWLQEDDMPAQADDDDSPDVRMAPDSDDASGPVGETGLDLPRIDELRDLDPGDTTYLDRAIGNFVTNTPDTLATIRAAWESGDAPQLKAVSHKLAGGALNLGVFPAGRIAQQIEVAVDADALESAGRLIEALDLALAQGRLDLLAYQATYSGPSQLD